MKNLSSWLVTIFAFMFWAFRVFVCFAYNMGIDFPVVPLNFQFEMIILVITFIILLFVAKRKLYGAIAYLITYGIYFGVDLYQNIMAIVEGGASISMISSVFMSFIAMLLPVWALLDMLFDKGRQLHPKDKKTDWFYINEEYDRKLDERADKNNYRTL